MWQKLSIAVAILVLLLSRLVQNRWTDRGSRPAELEAAVAKLDRLPLIVGPWRGEALPLDAESVAHAQLAGTCWRRYRHTLTGDVVSVLLVCGDFRPVAVHPPDACYEGAGYERMDKPVRRTFAPPAPALPAEFWTALFHKPGAAIPGQLRIYWSWTTGGSWEAADNPRLAFAGSPVLYKLYVLSETVPTEGVPDRDPCKEFMDEWLPELQKTLFRKDEG